jgi:hypothetical protein
LETKIGNFKNFFIPCPARTYLKYPAYNFVDFRIKHAGSSNYGGLLFSPPAEKGKITKAVLVIPAPMA